MADALFDHVCDVRNDLHCLAEIIAAAFLENHGFVDLPTGKIIVSGENAVSESLVMTKVEVGFRTVVQHIDFSVLEWIHRSGVNIEIWIELLKNNTQSASFEQCSQGCRSQAFA